MSKPLSTVPKEEETGPVAPLTTPVLDVYQKLLLIQGEIGTLEKQGTNSNQGYKYAREVDFIHALKPLLQKHKLVFYQQVGTASKVDHLINKNANGDEKSSTLTTVGTRFILKNVELGAAKDDFIAIDQGGQGADRGDKGIYKAITGAKKYALQNLFMVATGDDPEKDEAEETPRYTAKKAAFKGNATGPSTSDF